MLTTLLIGLAFAVSAAIVMVLLRVRMARKARDERRQRRRAHRQVADRAWWSMLWERRFGAPKHKALTYQRERDTEK